ncbi:HI0933 family protein [Alkaliphilus metalliredigens QYMF]|uniref:HI0933 family protein n=1 Tax=Alkaliphilus metalliredigens (strain QYMF) TaxID=293826 RepID=A6TRG3_ALKMQ|nr:NAD(P)/FAD-dependent oxidoreductase [Alkaliphilus metalliredigens]ABR48781.1 HI0933 family protein [Alkaliphilus metalliredigens QYMF]
MNNSVVVIGGGPAGMMAALMAAQKGKSVILLEKNMQVGKKLAITGGGRCNVTNYCDPSDIIVNTMVNGKFLYKAINTFTPYDLIDFLCSHDVETKIEKDNKVFPQSNRSADVISLFENLLKKHNVKIRYNATVKSILTSNGKVLGVQLNNNESIYTQKVILSTGGMSYPHTGSTGDGFKLAKQIGHRIIKLRPSLVSLELNESWVKTLMGISLEDVIVSYEVEGKKRISLRDSILFTHYGCSGPVILKLSAYIARYLQEGTSPMSVDFLPNMTEHVLLEKLLSRNVKGHSKTIRGFLQSLLPKNFVLGLLKTLQINEDILLSQLSKVDRNIIIQSLKGMIFTIKQMRSINEAIITSGGIDIKEVDPSTMESKLLKGLYFAGEILDVDALTGGFNLQIAFSTGFLAGSST